MSLPAFPGNQKPENQCCAWEHQCQEVWRWLSCFWCQGYPLGTSPSATPPVFPWMPNFPSGAPTSLWQCHTGDTMDKSPPRRTQGVEAALGSLMLFSPSPGEGRASGRGSGYQRHLSIPGATRGTRTSRAVALLCFYGAACSLPFSEGGIAESEVCIPRGRHSGEHQPVPQLHRRAILFHHKKISLANTQQVWSSPWEAPGSASH